MRMRPEFNASQAVPTAKGQALADEYGIKFFETVSNLVTKHLAFIILWRFLIVTILYVSECKNEPKCRTGFLFNS